MSLESSTQLAACHMCTMDVLEQPIHFEGCSHIFHSDCVVAWRGENLGCDGGCPACLEAMAMQEKQPSPASVPPGQHERSDSWGFVAESDDLAR